MTLRLALCPPSQNVPGVSSLAEPGTGCSEVSTPSLFPSLLVYNIIWISVCF